MKKTRPCKIIRKFSNNEHEWKLWAQFDVLLSFYVYELYEYTKVNSVVDEVEDAKKKVLRNNAINILRKKSNKIKKCWIRFRWQLCEPLDISSIWLSGRKCQT